MIIAREDMANLDLMGMQWEARNEIYEQIWTYDREGSDTVGEVGGGCASLLSLRFDLYKSNFCFFSTDAHIATG